MFWTKFWLTLPWAEQGSVRIHHASQSRKKCEICKFVFLEFSWLKILSHQELLRIPNDIEKPKELDDSHSHWGDQPTVSYVNLFHLLLSQKQYLFLGTFVFIQKRCTCHTIQSHWKVQDILWWDMLGLTLNFFLKTKNLEFCTYSFPYFSYDTISPGLVHQEGLRPWAHSWECSSYF